MRPFVRSPGPSDHAQSSGVRFTPACSLRVPIDWSRGENSTIPIWWPTRTTESSLLSASQRAGQSRSRPSSADTHCATASADGHGLHSRRSEAEPARSILCLKYRRLRAWLPGGYSQPRCQNHEASLPSPTRVQTLPFLHAAPWNCFRTAESCRTDLSDEGSSHATRVASSLSNTSSLLPRQLDIPHRQRHILDLPSRTRSIAPSRAPAGYRFEIHANGIRRSSPTGNCRTAVEHAILQGTCRMPAGRMREPWMGC